MRALFTALLSGLEDYTTDERGDVGSWLRIASVRGLATVISLLLAHAPALDLHLYLPPALFHAAVGGILKQGAERLDNVRQQAGEQLVRLLGVPPPAVPGGEAWSVCGAELMRGLFLRCVVFLLVSWRVLMGGC